VKPTRTPGPRFHLRACRRIVLFVIPFALAQSNPAQESKSSETWHFAVSGDSRNCGDVVMPAIAERVRAEHSAFYWHLGDYRAIYDFDQDIKTRNPNINVITYENSAWKDFIDRQLKPFGDLPVYLALGNHELISPKTRTEALLQFADWYNAPDLSKQRLTDDPSDHELRAYYHWTRKGVDFIALDNSAPEQFDDAQMKWLAAQLDRDAKNAEVRGVVVGMHDALPDSMSAGRSMNESAQGTVSGRKVYQWLVEFRKKANKNVYVLASHLHFLMDNVYNTACRRDHPDEVLPGWIVGTAGAPRYRLPADVSGSALHLTDVYGYLLANVSPDGAIQFEFKQINEADVTESTRKDYKDEFIHSCFVGNSSTYVPEGANCPMK
jgi:Calcineurin-like phosphoesterase